IVTAVDRNLRQPCLERSRVRSVISVQREIGFSESVLDDLFDLFALQEEATADSPHLPPMAFEQLFERAFVPGHSRADQSIIGWFYKRSHQVILPISSLKPSRSWINRWQSASSAIRSDIAPLTPIPSSRPATLPGPAARRTALKTKRSKTLRQVII